jgi:hypothetical protein
MFSTGIPEQAVFEGSHTVDNPSGATSTSAKPKSVSQWLKR